MNEKEAYWKLSGKENDYKKKINKYFTDIYLMLKKKKIMNIGILEIIDWNGTSKLGKSSLHEPSRVRDHRVIF